jgi:hypothetical protein
VRSPENWFALMFFRQELGETFVYSLVLKLLARRAALRMNVQKHAKFKAVFALRHKIAHSNPSIS